MKIGLISYHKDPNYGTMLQAYALAHMLRRMGVKAEYIRYHAYPKPPLMKRMVKALLQTSGWRRQNEFDFFHTKPFRQTMRAFKQFHNRYIPVSGKTYYADNIHECNRLYNRFMVGSDQTWSPWLNQDPYGINMLSFVDRDNRKYAYAPSLGTTHPDSAFIERLSAKINTFALLSCREGKNCRMLERTLDRRVDEVLDPTLLLTAREWDKLATPTGLERGSYVLAYILGEKKEIASFAERAARSMGLPVYYIVTRPCYLGKEHALNGIGPDKFLTLVRDAALVVTDSFHGTLFSMSYSVPFYSFNKRKGNEGDNDRIIELLADYMLEDRFRKDHDTHLSTTDIDFDLIQGVFEDLREESMIYLYKCITQ